jgi:hypothetical protein
LLVPVNQKLGFIEPRARPGLPTGVVRYGAEERDAIGTLALDQDLRVRIALIDQVLGGE